ncbi:hypothetical protein Lal_00019506 [Lupinus albus]|nr:hypothetical protein Lal_00019506 [Lupinus albus]
MPINICCYFKYTIISIRYSIVLSSYVVTNKYFRTQCTDDEVVVEDDGEDDEEQPQLITRCRGRLSQQNEQLRVHPTRRRKQPVCDTSSLRSH